MTTWLISIHKDARANWEIALANGFWDTSQARREMRRDDTIYFRLGGKRGHLLGSTRLTWGPEPLDPSKPRPWIQPDSRRYTSRFGIELVAPADDGVLWSSISDRVALDGIDQTPIRMVQDKASEDWLLLQVSDVPRGYTQEEAEAADRIVASLDPSADTRELILTALKLRQGQGKFRRSLLQAYGSRCAVTGVDLKDLLEAAHIMPYRGTDTNRTDNGLLLRADIHTLFDLHLLTIVVEAGRFIVRCAPELNDSEYMRFDQKALAQLPENSDDLPHPDHLTQHNEGCGWLRGRGA